MFGGLISLNLNVTYTLLWYGSGGNSHITVLNSRRRLNQVCLLQLRCWNKSWLVSICRRRRYEFIILGRCAIVHVNSLVKK